MNEAIFVVGDRYGNEHALLARGDAIELATRVYAASDDEGIIQAWDMVSLFPGQVEMHTTTRVHIALLAAGCEDAARTEDDALAQ